MFRPPLELCFQVWGCYFLLDSHHLVSMDVYSIREPMEEPAKTHFSNAEKEKLLSHERFKLDVAQKLSHGHPLSNISDALFQADMYKAMDKMQELLHLLIDKTSDIQIAIPEAIPPEIILKAGQRQEHLDSYSSHISGFSKDLATSVHALKQDLNSLASSITSLEKKNNAMLDTMHLMMKSLQELLGTNSGSRSKLDQLQILSNLVHDKISLLEDVSKRSHENGQGLQDLLFSHRTWISYLFLYAALFQIILLCGYVLYKRITSAKSNNPQFDRKFI